MILYRTTGSYVYALRTYVCFIETVRQKGDFIPLPQRTQTGISLQKNQSQVTNIAYNPWHRILPEIYDKRKISLRDVVLLTHWLAVL